MVKMAAEAEPEAKRPCNAAVRLYPLKGVVNLRERYAEDTADVFFVDGETKERLPAHREVLKVASPVFFTMFNGDWKEKEEREITATEDFRWESFLAAIALLYGEEVEVEESSIPDMYRVAHYYDLRAVVSSLAHSIQMWDHHQLSTVVGLCALAGHVEAEQSQEENELIKEAVKYIAQHLEHIRKRAVDITGLSYQGMLMLVKSEDVTSSELEVLATLNQWIDANPDVTVGRAQEIFSHIRYGILPFSSLVHCRVGQSSLDMTIRNHMLLVIENLRTSLAQITTRKAQKEVCQLYPLIPGLGMIRQKGKCKLTFVSSFPAVAIIYSGRQELCFEFTIAFSGRFPDTAALVCELCSVTDRDGSSNEVQLRTPGALLNTGGAVLFSRVLVEVSASGGSLTLYSETQCEGTTLSKTADLSFSGPFPWILTLGVRATSKYALTFAHPTL